MISKQLFFTTTDGTPFPTVEAAQIHELAAFLEAGEIADDVSAKKLAELLLAKKEHIVDLLTTKSSSRPKARRINGGGKKHKASAPATRPATDVPGD